MSKEISLHREVKHHENRRKISTVNGYFYSILLKQNHQTIIWNADITNKETIISTNARSFLNCQSQRDVISSSPLFLHVEFVIYSITFVNTNYQIRHQKRPHRRHQCLLLLYNDKTPLRLINSCLILISFLQFLMGCSFIVSINQNNNYSSLFC